MLQVPARVCGYSPNIQLAEVFSGTSPSFGNVNANLCQTSNKLQQKKEAADGPLASQPFPSLTITITRSHDKPSAAGGRDEAWSRRVGWSVCVCVWRLSTGLAVYTSEVLRDLAPSNESNPSIEFTFEFPPGIWFLHFRRALSS